MDTQKNPAPETDETTNAATPEPTSFKAKREQWEAEWKAELKRDWEKNWKHDWKQEWKGEWKKHAKHAKHNHAHNAAVKLELNGQSYSISIGKLIFGIVLLTLLPFHWVLFGGALWAAYHFGRQSAEKDNEDDDAPKVKREDITAA